MSTPFGAPIYDQPTTDQSPSATTAGPNGSALNEPVPTVSLDDPLLSEPLNVNLEEDAYAMPPPPPDGRYRAKLKLMQQDDPQHPGQKADFLLKMSKKGTPYINLSLIAYIIDPNGKYDNIPIYERNVATAIFRGNASQVSTILSKLKQPTGEPWVKPGQQLNQPQWKDIFLKAMAAEPEIGIETQWEWSCRGCGEAAKAAGAAYPRAIRGMHNFPQQKGVYSPEMACSVNKSHGTSRAQAAVALFLHLHELKK